MMRVMMKWDAVINLFKKSIDKVFDRVSAFTFEKYKEENDDEEDDEENYREFEYIKEMVLYFRDSCNELLQLDYSLANLMRLKGYKEAANDHYQKDLNDEEFQNDLREWRRSKR